MARNYTKRKVWTTEEIERMTKLYQARMPMPEIAKRLNRTYTSVTNKIRKLGITKDGSKVIHGNVVTKAQLDMAEQNDITLGSITYRLSKGMSVLDAITLPARQQEEQDSVITHDELVKIVGRMKYMNMNECKTNPMQPTKPMLDRLAERNITVDEIREVEC